METLKECRNILLGHRNEVFTDHKNLVHEHFNTERAMRWRLILEEFGPTLTHIKGEQNIVADTLSRLDSTEEEFSSDAFAGNLMGDFPFSCALTCQEQPNDPELMNRCASSDLHDRKVYRHADEECDLIVRTDEVTNQTKIVVPKTPQKKLTEWCHLHLLHPGETRTELTMGQHFHWKGTRVSAARVCKGCEICRRTKVQTEKCGLLPAKAPDVLPWHALCIDLMGPHRMGKGQNEVQLHCLTMINPATGWFEIVETPNRRADEVANSLEMTWLTRYPWPTEVVMDRGGEFQAEVSAMLKNNCGITKKVVTPRDPAANSMVERVHQAMHQLIRTLDIKGKTDCDQLDFGWVLMSAMCEAARSTVHATQRATPVQSVFGRDAILNVAFEADWQCIKERKLHRIVQNNKKENATRIPHQCAVGDRAMMKQDPSRKHGSDRHSGPLAVCQINDNGTLKRSRTAPGEVVHETWNIGNLNPCMA